MLPWTLTLDRVILPSISALATIKRFNWGPTEDDKHLWQPFFVTVAYKLMKGDKEALCELVVKLWRLKLVLAQTTGGTGMWLPGLCILFCTIWFLSFC